MSKCCGDVAQMGERGVRNAEVRGSIPLISTNPPLFCWILSNPDESEPKSGNKIYHESIPPNTDGGW